MFFKIFFLRFRKIYRKTSMPESFSWIFQLFKKEPPTQVFSCQFYEINNINIDHFCWLLLDKENMVPNGSKQQNDEQNLFKVNHKPKVNNKINNKNYKVAHEIQVSLLTLNRSPTLFWSFPWCKCHLAIKTVEQLHSFLPYYDGGNRCSKKTLPVGMSNFPPPGE